MDLKNLIKSLGITQTEFAKEIGVSKSVISDLISGRLQELPKHARIKLVKLYNVNPVWLLTGEGDMFLSSNNGGNSGVVIHGGNFINSPIGNNSTVTYNLTKEEAEIIDNYRENNYKTILQKIAKLLMFWM